MDGKEWAEGPYSEMASTDRLSSISLMMTIRNCTPHTASAPQAAPTSICVTDPVPAEVAVMNGRTGPDDLPNRGATPRVMMPFLAREWLSHFRQVEMATSGPMPVPDSVGDCPWEAYARRGARDLWK